MMRRFLTLTLGLLLASTTALGQELTRALPAETILAIGVQDLAGHADKLDDVIAEAERLRLGEHLSALAGEAEEAAGDLPEEVPASLQDLDPLEAFGQEAWFVVSHSPFNPIPAATFVSLTTGAATGQLGAFLDELAAQEGAQSFSEGDGSFYLFPIDDPEVPIPGVAAGMAGEVFVFSTNPEALRGVYRKLAGADEPSLQSSELYTQTVGELGEANLYTLFDFNALADTLAPALDMLGQPALAQRISSDVRTIGVYASASWFEDDGMRSGGMRIAGADSPAFAALLAGPPGVSRQPLEFVSPSALGVAVSYVDLPGWWDYLNELMASIEDLGGMSLNDLVMSFTGIDLGTLLFSWMGTEVATITGDLGEVVQPGVPTDNMLGEVVYMVSTTDDAAAQQGLSTLFGSISGMVAGFADPSGQGAANIERREVAGQQVVSYEMAPGVTVAHAVVDGWVLLATSDKAMDDALVAYDLGAGLTGTLGRLAGQIPADASAYSISNDSETFAQAGSLYAAQLQMFAGLAGGEIDFDAIQEAGAAFEEFFDFLAERAGGTVSYTVPVASGISQSEGFTEFEW